jgi:hypothetical protein
MNIEITSAGKKAQKLSDVAAAIFVITQEDLQRSGVTSIPGALRLVPGLQVARIDANKLLVLIDGQSPQHQVSFRASLDVPGNLAFDAWVRYVDALPALRADSYVTLDARPAWRPWPQLELALVGQNLVESAHREFVSVDGISTQVQRGVYGKITWGF